MAKNEKDKQTNNSAHDTTCGNSSTTVLLYLNGILVF